MAQGIPEPATLRKAAMRGASFEWEDPLRLQGLLTDEERMIQESARVYAQERLLPRILQANRHETFDVSVMREMAELGFLGATIDLDETYEWGLDELARIVAEQEAVAAELYGPGTTPEEAMARLDADPARQLHGTDALQRWMQETSDAAVDALGTAPRIG